MADKNFHTGYSLKMETNIFLTCLLSVISASNPLPILGVVFTILLMVVLHRTTRGLPGDAKSVLFALAQNHQLRPVVYELSFTATDEEGSVHEPVLPKARVNKEEFFEAINKCRNKFCLEKLFKLVSDRKQALVTQTEDAHSLVIDADILAYGEIEHHIAVRKAMFEQGEPETFDASEFCDYMLCCFNKQNWHELLTEKMKAEAIRLGCLSELVLRSLELRFAE